MTHLVDYEAGRCVAEDATAAREGKLSCGDTVREGERFYYLSGGSTLCERCWDTYGWRSPLTDGKINKEEKRG